MVYRFSPPGWSAPVGSTITLSTPGPTVLTSGGPTGESFTIENSFAALINHQEGACCNGDSIRGNVDGLGGPSGEIDVADLSFWVDFLFHGGPRPPCDDEGNVDGMTGPGGPFDVADLSYLVDYLFKGGPPPTACP